jgi:hypothetical protein
MGVSLSLPSRPACVRRCQPSHVISVAGSGGAVRVASGKRLWRGARGSEQNRKKHNQRQRKPGNNCDQHGFTRASGVPYNS